MCHALLSDRHVAEDQSSSGAGARGDGNEGAYDDDVGVCGCLGVDGNMVCMRIYKHIFIETM